MISKENKHYVECICDSSEHIMRYVYLDRLPSDTKPEDMYVEVQLYPFHGVFGRIWRAIKYVFGYECKYGHWDCTCMNTYEIEGLIEYLNEYVKKQKEIKKGKDKKDQSAASLVSAQIEMDSGIQSVYRIMSSDEHNETEPIKLLTCNTETTASGIVPVLIHADSKTPYPVLYIELSPEEFKDIIENFDEYSKKNHYMQSDWKLGSKLFNKELNK